MNNVKFTSQNALIEAARSLLLSRRRYEPVTPSDIARVVDEIRDFIRLREVTDAFFDSKD